MPLNQGDQLLSQSPNDRVYVVEELSPTFLHGNPARTGTPELYVVALLREDGTVAAPVEEPSPTAADGPAPPEEPPAEPAVISGSAPVPEGADPLAKPEPGDVPPPNPQPEAVPTPA